MSEKKDVLDVKDEKTIVTESSAEQTETCSCPCECGCECECECEDEGCCECEGDIEYGSCACAADDGGCVPRGEENNPISPEDLKLKKDQEELDRLNKLFDKAMDICIHVHSGQADLAGFDYTEHPIRVSSKALKYNFEYILSKPMRLKVIITSLLHDVIEDSMIQPEQLEEIFGKDIADAVVSVSRNKDEDYMDYVNRAAENPIGRWVKYFDLQDNLDISRFVRNSNYEFTDKDLRRLNKYAKAYRYLAKELGTNDIIFGESL